MDNKQSNLKIKKQLSLVLFLPFFVSMTYSNSYNDTVMPLIYISNVLTENVVENKYTIKKINSIKKLINNVITEPNVYYTINKKIFKIKIIVNKIIGREYSIVFNRGSPVCLTI